MAEAETPAKCRGDSPTSTLLAFPAAFTPVTVRISFRPLCGAFLSPPVFGVSVMSHLLNTARRLVVREEGATMVEYGLMVALIAVVCVGAVTLIGTNLSGMFNTMSGNF